MLTLRGYDNMLSALIVLHHVTADGFTSLNILSCLKSTRKQESNTNSLDILHKFWVSFSLQQNGRQLINQNYNYNINLYSAALQCCPGVLNNVTYSKI